MIGVPPTVDFERLSEMLPITPVIRDARSRRFNRQSPPQNARQSGAADSSFWTYPSRALNDNERLRS
ncbi:MAG: hypothetical protein EA381_17205 [Planctomycetaceae bacterium]|nr:MAG: hypothetical protein EA381_17205 [Planctomycetaceae bacterium]